MYCTPEEDRTYEKYDEPSLHMKCLLKTHLVEFDLSLRILIPLEKAGIITLGDLIKHTRCDLAKLNRLGRLSIEILGKLLDRYSLSFAEK